MEPADHTDSHSFAADALRRDSGVNVAAAGCRSALEAWELQTRTVAPTVRSLDDALAEPLERLRQAAEVVVGRAESPWLLTLHHDLQRAVAGRSPVPRGHVPWGDEQPGADVHLQMLDAVLAGLAGEPVERLPVLIKQAMTESNPHNARGYFRWDQETRTLLLGPVRSTPFDGGKKTPMGIVALLAERPSHRSTVSGLATAFRDPNREIDKNTVDRQLAVIRQWLRGQPHPVWRAVDVVRDDQHVRLVVDPGRLDLWPEIRDFFAA